MWRTAVSVWMATNSTKSSTSNTALAVSSTCQTTTAAISIGLPSASLTLATSVSWLRIRVEIRPARGQRVHPAQAVGTDGAGVAAEQLYDAGLAGCDRGQPDGHGHGKDDQHDLGGQRHGPAYGVQRDRGGQRHDDGAQHRPAGQAPRHAFGDLGPWHLHTHDPSSFLSRIYHSDITFWSEVT